LPKSVYEERVLADEAVPSSTKYKTKLALKIFREWQQQRGMKVPILDPGGLFQDYELHKVNHRGYAWMSYILTTGSRSLQWNSPKIQWKGIHPELCMV